MSGLLAGIFDNPALRKAAFSQVGKLIKSEGLDLIVVRLDPETGEIIVNMYKHGEATILITKNPETDGIIQDSK